MNTTVDRDLLFFLLGIAVGMVIGFGMAGGLAL